MKKLSKVKNVQSNGSFENQYGAEQPDGKKLLFKFEYEFEDGVVLTANHQTTVSPFPIGSDVEYEITRESEQYGKSGKVSKPEETSFSGGKSKDAYIKGIEVGHAVNNAVNMLCAGLVFDDVPTDANNDNKIYLYAKHIMKISEKLKDE